MEQQFIDKQGLSDLSTKIKTYIKETSATKVHGHKVEDISDFPNYAGATSKGGSASSAKKLDNPLIIKTNNDTIATFDGTKEKNLEVSILPGDDISLDVSNGKVIINASQAYVAANKEAKKYAENASQSATNAESWAKDIDGHKTSALDAANQATLAKEMAQAAAQEVTSSKQSIINNLYLMEAPAKKEITQEKERVTSSLQTLEGSLKESLNNEAATSVANVKQVANQAIQAVNSEKDKAIGEGTGAIPVAVNSVVRTANTATGVTIPKAVSDGETKIAQAADQGASSLNDVVSTVNSYKIEASTSAEAAKGYAEDTKTNAEAVSRHLNNKENPHNVTAHQVLGAVSGNSANTFLKAEGNGSYKFINLPEAGANSSGIVTQGDQVFNGNKTFSKNVIISGNLIVDGDTTSLNVANLDVEDKVITLGAVKDPSSNPPTEDLSNCSGIMVATGYSGKAYTGPSFEWEKDSGWVVKDDRGLVSPKIKVGNYTLTTDGYSGNAATATKVNKSITINNITYDGSVAKSISIPYITSVKVIPNKVENNAKLNALASLDTSKSVLTFNLDIPKGNTGASAKTIRRINGTGGQGVTDTYEMLNSEGASMGTFTIHNGADSTKAGPRGASITGITKTQTGSQGTEDTYSIQDSDGKTLSSVLKIYHPKDGAPGKDSTIPGPQGASINKVTKTSGSGAAGTTDIYSIYTDASAVSPIGTFNVYNGKNGIPGTPGKDGNPGADGKSLEHQWVGTKLQVRTKGESVWEAGTDLKGAPGTTGTITLQKEVTVSGTTGTPTASLTEISGSTDNARKYKLTLNNIKGNTGDTGTITLNENVTINSTTGTPQGKLTEVEGSTANKRQYQLTLSGIKGEPGKDSTEPGPRGASITNVKKTSGNGSAGTKDIYSIYNTDSENIPIGTFSVYNGANGTPGAAAGFSTPTVDNSKAGGVGTPKVTVTASGENTAKAFKFSFENLKGEPGNDAIIGTPTYDNTLANQNGTAKCVVTASGASTNKIFNFKFENLKGNTGPGLESEFKGTTLYVWTKGSKDTTTTSADLKSTTPGPMGPNEITTTTKVSNISDGNLLGVSGSKVVAVTNAPGIVTSSASGNSKHSIWMSAGSNNKQAVSDLGYNPTSKQLTFGGVTLSYNASVGSLDIIL